MNNYLMLALNTVDMIRILCLHFCMHLGKELILSEICHLTQKITRKM